MIKVMWLVKRADHLTLDDFRNWWLEKHAPGVTEHQKPYLNKYVINVRVANDSLPGMPPAGVADWDGITENWYESEADFRAVYGRSTPTATRADTLAHVSRFQRLVVLEHPIEVKR